MMQALTGLLLSTLAGCAIGDEDDYIDKRATAECKRIERCFLGEFQSQFSGREDCENLVADELQAEQEILQDADCDYDPAEARRCVRRINNLSCADWIERGTPGACDLVYTCEP